MTVKIGKRTLPAAAFFFFLMAEDLEISDYLSDNNSLRVRTDTKYVTTRGAALASRCGCDKALVAKEVVAWRLDRVLQHPKANGTNQADRRSILVDK